MVNYACAFGQSEQGKYFELMIMHLICPPPPAKFCIKLFSISMGTAVILRRNEKQRLYKFRGANKVHHGRRASGEWRWFFILMQINLTSTRKVVYLALF